MNKGMEISEMTFRTDQKGEELDVIHGAWVSHSMTFIRLTGEMCSYNMTGTF